MAPLLSSGEGGHIQLYDHKLSRSAGNLLCLFAAWMVHGSDIHGHPGTAYHQPGFLLGPCCPIYGVGLVGITLLFQGSRHGFWHIFFCIILLCSALEYFVSFLMEKLFHTRWWDYHDMKFHINGRICLETMLPFGILGTFALYRVNPFLIAVFRRIPPTISGKLLILTVFFFLADLVISVRVLHQISLPEGKSDHTAEISRRVREALTKRIG